MTARGLIGNCRAVDSSWMRHPGPGTQSVISPGFGGVNARSPSLGKVPMDCAELSRGLNHQAFTEGPWMVFIRTVNGRPTGAYTIA